MQISSLKTHKIQVGESLENILDQYIKFLPDASILAITSKIISTCQERVVKKDQVDKYTLIKQEADLIAYADSYPYDFYLTIKDGILLPSAGIDESNSNEMYILPPKNIQATAHSIWQYLRTKHTIKQLGILITDSNTTPLRRGVIGVALGWCGFEPLYSYINKPDIYGYPLRVTQVNILDALATSAVLNMGEGDEQTPLAIIQEAPKIAFLDRPPSAEEESSIKIPLEEDLYSPLLVSTKWLKGDA